MSESTSTSTSPQRPALEPHVLTPEDLWALTTYDFTVTHGPGGRPCIFKMRRLDLMTQLLEDVLNAPLLKASMAIIQEVQAWITAEEGRTFESAFEHLDAEKKRTVLQQLQHYATKAVLQPKLVREPTGAADEFPVTMLGADTLFAIWNHQPPEATVPRLSEVAATDFRPTAGAAPDRAAPDGDGVRPASLVLAPEPSTTQ